MKNLLILFLLPLMLTIQNCRPQEIEEPLPEYMFERFRPGKSCHEVDYMILKFPDSTVLISDTMSHVRRFDGFGAEEASVGFNNYYQPFNPGIINQSGISYRFIFSDNQKTIKNLNQLIQVGSYKFYNRLLAYDRDNYNGGVYFMINYNDLSGLYGMHQNSIFFHVLNKKGNSYELKICGDFDLVLSHPYPDTTNFTRLQGEYSITMIDSFFR